MSKLDDAIREAYASVGDGVVILDTIEIYHPSLEIPLFITNDRDGFDATLEDGTIQHFEPLAFDFSLPEVSSDGRQDISIAIDNVGQVISDFISKVIGTQYSVVIRYRPYLWPDLSKPQMSPPLELTLNDISIDLYKVSGRASFADVINMPFPNEYYNRDRFPNLEY